MWKINREPHNLVNFGKRKLFKLWMETSSPLCWIVLICDIVHKEVCYLIITVKRCVYAHVPLNKNEIHRNEHLLNDGTTQPFVWIVINKKHGHRHSRQRLFGTNKSENIIFKSKCQCRTRRWQRVFGVSVEFIIAN